MLACSGLSNMIPSVPGSDTKAATRCGSGAAGPRRRLVTELNHQSHESARGPESGGLESGSAGPGPPSHGRDDLPVTRDSCDSVIQVHSDRDLRSPAAPQ